MTTARFYAYNQTRLLMHRHRRRVFLRRAVLLGGGLLCLASLGAFLIGFNGVGL